MSKRSVVERFWTKVAKAGAGDCWPWTGAVMKKNGYGVLNLGAGHGTKLAHRLAYELCVGEIAEGLQVDHRCHNADRACLGGSGCAHRRCVNPTHLEAVPQRSNLLRGLTLQGVNSRKEACPRGHPYDWLYLREGRGPERRCSKCHRGPYGKYVLLKEAS